MALKYCVAVLRDELERLVFEGPAFLLVPARDLGVVEIVAHLTLEGPQGPEEIDLLTEFDQNDRSHNGIQIYAFADTWNSDKLNRVMAILGYSQDGLKWDATKSERWGKERHWW